MQLSGICAAFPGPECPEGSYHYAENHVHASLTHRKRFISSEKNDLLLQRQDEKHLIYLKRSGQEKNKF